MKPIPTEMRRRLLEDCGNGLSERKAALKWNVGRSTISKIKYLRHAQYLYCYDVQEP